MNEAIGLLGFKPKHALIAENVRDRIVSGGFRKGDRLLPDDQLALRYRVNKQTVANALNTLVKEGLLERAPRRGTTVIHDFKKHQSVSKAVGMMMLSEGEVYGDIFRGITQRFPRHGLYPVLIDKRMASDHGLELEFLKSLISEPAKPYGVLIDSLHFCPFAFLQEHADRLHNAVFIIHYAHPERLPFAKYALVDLAQAGRLAARHFISRGHKKLCCLALPEPDNPGGAMNSIQVQLMKGFAQECRAQNIPFADAVFWNLLLGAPLKTVLNSLLQGADRPTAIFSYADFFIGEKIIPFCESQGIRPGQDLELIGFYNTRPAVEGGFSSISIQEDQIAAAALNLLTGETDAQEIMIEPKLVVR